MEIIVSTKKYQTNLIAWRRTFDSEFHWCAVKFKLLYFRCRSSIPDPIEIIFFEVPGIFFEVLTTKMVHAICNKLNLTFWRIFVLNCYMTGIRMILTLIRESWKKIQNAGPWPRVFCGKKSRAQHWINLYMFLCCGFFFRKTRSVTVPKNGI